MIALLLACNHPEPYTKRPTEPAIRIHWERLDAAGLPALVGVEWPVGAMAGAGANLYVALGELGLWRSTDEGASFSAVDLPLDVCVPLGLYVTAAGRVLVTCHTDTATDGIWASDDGIAFASSAEGLAPSNEYDAHFVELDGRLFYDAAVVSDDDGRTWSTTDGAPTGCVPYTWSGQLFCQRTAVRDSHTWASTDAGATWTDVTDAGTSALELSAFVELAGATWALDEHVSVVGDPMSPSESSVVRSADGVVWELFDGLPSRSETPWITLAGSAEMRFASLDAALIDESGAEEGPVYYSRDGTWHAAIGRTETSAAIGRATAAVVTETHALLLTAEGLVRAELGGF